MPTDDQVNSYFHQFLIHIIRVLPKYIPAFESQYPEHHPLLQHHPRRPLPHSHKTEFFPLKMCLIEEATVVGNIRVHDDIYINQLGMNPVQLGEYAIPLFADQLTLARTRSAQRHRRKETDVWERREVFQLGLGLFHLCMNLIWALLHTHRGTVLQPGSLNFFFSVLDKKRLGNDKPDYHTLLVTLQQIINGLLLYAWKRQCGHSSLGDFANCNPSPDTLLTMAKSILNMYRPLPSNEDNNSGVDIIYQNTCRLLRDLLYVQELIHSISHGDFGRVEDLFPDLARIFRGAGSNNYCIEILHFLHAVQKVWTPGFANIMRDNMLVNVSGLPGHFMGIDMNIEHIIGELKILLASKGVYTDWHTYRDISPAIKYLELLKKRVRYSTKCAYQKTGHTKGDFSTLVWRVASVAESYQLLEEQTERAENKVAVAFPDLLAIGHKKFESSTLNTFNAKLKEWRDGIPAEDIKDDIPVTDFAEGSYDDND
ncbi:hypothetical protein K435DRAFT_880153 [Dendrothele bispora CBS 962.96]|uniref:DUF6589 domain-containing protein n=1 Tax=Dendrothele bispora (strain CBS 962.96) TaxID=1314807 RepID=A0A4S8KK12_DENBC|nr:hypothetical protein K435DRAFT_880153 [Dendrothele bispora CBS 962.96]